MPISFTQGGAVEEGEETTGEVVSNFEDGDDAEVIVVQHEANEGEDEELGVQEGTTTQITNNDENNDESKDEGADEDRNAVQPAEDDEQAVPEEAMGEVHKNDEDKDTDAMMNVVQPAEGEDE